MKIYLVTSNPGLNEFQRQQLEKAGKLIALNVQKLSTTELVEQAPDAEILIAGSSGIGAISRELLEGLKQLKYITLLTVGYDWVDIEAAKDRGIPISNVKGANSESVAEHIWGMILDLAKRITEFNRDAREKGAYKFGDYRGKEVHEKTLGVIGLGDIGTKVARIAKGFDMKVIGVNKSGRPVKGVTLVDLPTLLRESDATAVCVPLTPETENMISDEQFKLMKDGVILVNCAREAIVNKEAVLNAVTCGKVFGYGVETPIMKPVPKDDPYLKYPNIIVTPHNAFNTEDAEVKTYDMAVENIQSFLKGSPQNLIT